MEPEPRNFQFVHRDPGEDDFTVSDGPRLRGMTRERLEDEVRKCTLMCRKCARQIAAMRKGDDLSAWEKMAVRAAEEEALLNKAPACVCPECGHTWIPGKL